MNQFELLFGAGAVGAVAFLGYFAAGRSGAGKWQIAALLAAGFFAFTLIPVMREGPLGFVANHNASFWGIQVFWDLILALCAALFLAAPRMKRAGMNLWLSALPVALLGSIGLLVVLTRLFWLEQRQQAAD
jgi:hypothetical protein